VFDADDCQFEEGYLDKEELQRTIKVGQKMTIFSELEWTGKNWAQVRCFGNWGGLQRAAKKVKPDKKLTEKQKEDAKKDKELFSSLKKPKLQEDVSWD